MSSTYAQFMEQHKDKIFCKFINDDNIHHKLRYKIGLNIDPKAFNPTPNYNGGGLYFTDLDNAMKYVYHGGNLVFIELCKDKDVLFFTEPCGTIYKTNKFIINEFISLKLEDNNKIQELEYEIQTLENEIPKYENTIKTSEEKIKELENKIKELTNRKQIDAIHQVIIETHQIIVNTHKSITNARQSITEIPQFIAKIRQLAVWRDGFQLKHVKEKTEELCTLALRKTGNVLQHIEEHEQTEELCRIAIKTNRLAIKHVKNDEMRNQLEIELETEIENELALKHDKREAIIAKLSLK